MTGRVYDMKGFSVERAAVVVCIRGKRRDGIPSLASFPVYFSGQAVEPLLKLEMRGTVLRTGFHAGHAVLSWGSLSAMLCSSSAATGAVNSADARGWVLVSSRTGRHSGLHEDNRK